MNTRILSFGHIPKYHGGRQQSGLANAMWAIASNMADSANGFEVVFCATDIRSRSTRIDGLPVIGWTTTSLLTTILRSPLRFISLCAGLAGLCREYKLPLLRTTIKTLHLEQAITASAPDILHLHGCDAAVYLQAGVFDSAKTLVTLHGVHGRQGPSELTRMEEALNRIPVRLLVFVTDRIAKEWRQTYGEGASCAEVVPNAFDSRVFFPSEKSCAQRGGEKDVFRLASIAAVCENKGQERIIEALTRFKATCASYDIEYAMIGNGDPKLIERLLCSAAAAGICVRHFPYMPPQEIREKLSKVDFMILASHMEGFGLVFLESIACGVPVVLPKDLPICEEPDLISEANAVLLESSSPDAVYSFLVSLPSHCFKSNAVAASLPEQSWKNVGVRYRSLIHRRMQNAAPGVTAMALDNRSVSGQPGGQLRSVTTGHNVKRSDG